MQPRDPSQDSAASHTILPWRPCARMSLRRELGAETEILTSAIRHQEKEHTSPQGHMHNTNMNTYIQTFIHTAMSSVATVRHHVFTNVHVTTAVYFLFHCQSTRSSSFPSAHPPRALPRHRSLPLYVLPEDVVPAAGAAANPLRR